MLGCSSFVDIAFRCYLLKCLVLEKKKTPSSDAASAFISSRRVGELCRIFCSVSDLRWRSSCDGEGYVHNLNDVLVRFSLLYPDFSTMIQKQINMVF